MWFETRKQGPAGGRPRTSRRMPAQRSDTRDQALKIQLRNRTRPLGLPAVAARPGRRSAARARFDAVKARKRARARTTVQAERRAPADSPGRGRAVSTPFPVLPTPGVLKVQYPPKKSYDSRSRTAATLEAMRSPKP